MPQLVSTRFRNPPMRDNAYKKAHRDMSCLIGVGCEGDVVLAHYRGGFHGMGIKPDDRHSMPLCARHHRWQHEMGERRFWLDVFANHEVLDRVMQWAGERRHELYREAR